LLAVALSLVVFGASAVAMVDAQIIVLAVGTTRGLRSALEGVVVATVVLAAIVGAVGVPLIQLVTIPVLRVAVATISLIFGSSWLRKAILHASEHIAIHDEDVVFENTVALSTGQNGEVFRRALHNGVGSVVAFREVILGGTEVVLNLLGLGASDHRAKLACRAWGSALVLVVGFGFVVAHQIPGAKESERVLALIGCAHPSLDRANFLAPTFSRQLSRDCARTS